MLIITLDTTRADRIGCYGYEGAETPNIDGLARNGVRFDNAAATVPLTLPSHCTIFTGSYPLYHQVRNNGRYRLPEKIDTLAEILKQHDFTTAAFVSSFTVDSRFGLDQGFDVYNDTLPVKKGGMKTYHSERPAGAVYDDFAAWFDSRRSGPFFAWVHFFDPHMPYLPPEPFKSRFKNNPYDGEIAYMDVYVGKVIDLLKEKGVLQNTLVIIAGDHGEAFGEHGETGHMMFCYETNIRVPLILSHPGRLPRAATVTARTDLTDIMPTVLDCLGLDAPGHMDGVSLLRRTKGEKPGKETPPRMFYIESVFPWEALGCAPVRGLVSGGYKFLDLPRPELYDLKNDPGETKNLYFKQFPTAKKMKQALHRLSKRYDPLQFQAKRTLSPKEERKLKTLGYVSASRRSSGAGKLPDPKEKIAGFTAFTEGNRLRGRGEAEAAIKKFRRAIEINPAFSWPYSSLALLHVERGQASKGLEILEQGMAKNPGEYQLQVDYALLLKKLFRPDEAVAVLDRLLKRRPVDVSAEINAILGDLHTQKGRKEKAAHHYRAALAGEPGNRVLKQKLVFLLHSLGKLPQALTIYTDLEKLTPEDTGLLMNMAVLCRQMGDKGAALSYYKKLTEGKMKPPVRVYYDYAVLLMETGDREAAVRRLQRFLTEAPPDHPLRKSAEALLKDFATKAQRH